MLKLNGGAKGAALPGGGSGILFMDVTLARNATTPKAIKHRFEISVAKAPAQASGPDADPTPEPPQDITFVGDPLPVGPGAVAPPLKGKRWVIGGGCCAPPSYHRGATLPINGAIRIAERFAIDFVQLNAKDMLYAGDMHEVEDYAYFGDEIYAVADGTVVATQDGLPEQVPGKLPDDATIDMAAGNHVVVDIGDGRFAFYAHMQPGSVKVKLGDKVVTGQGLGLLGNSGNTDTRICISTSWTDPRRCSPTDCPMFSRPLPERAASLTRTRCSKGARSRSQRCAVRAACERDAPA